MKRMIFSGIVAITWVAYSYAQYPTLRMLASRTDRFAQMADTHLNVIQADLSHVITDNMSAVDPIESKVEKISEGTADITSRIATIDSKLSASNAVAAATSSKITNLTRSELDHIAVNEASLTDASADMIDTMTTIKAVRSEALSSFDTVDAAIATFNQHAVSKSNTMTSRINTIDTKITTGGSMLNADLTKLATALTGENATIISAVDDMETKVLSATAALSSKTMLIAQDTRDQQTRLEDIDSHVDTISSFMPPIDSKLDVVTLYANDMQTRIADTDTKVDDMATRAPDIDSKVDAIVSFMPVIQSKTDILNIKTDDMQTRVTDIDSKIDDMQTRIVDIDTKVDDIQSRVDICANLCPIALTTGGTLNVIGGNYCLAGDVTGDITITASGITLDLNDHTLTGGITITTGADKVTVRNGKVTNVSNDAIQINAAYCTVTDCNLMVTISGYPISCTSSCSYATINRCTLIGPANSEGIYINNANHVTVSNSALIGLNGNEGTHPGCWGTYIVGTDILFQYCQIYTGNGFGDSGAGGWGICIDVGSSNVVVRHCTITTGYGGSGSTGGNGGPGIYINANDVVVESCDMLTTGSGGQGTPGGYGGCGIELYDDSRTHNIRISNCRINKTGAGGTSNGDGGDGIFIGTRAYNITIEGCSIESTGTGQGTGRPGYAICDTHTARDSMIYGNYALKTFGYVLNASSIDDVATYGTSFVAGTDRLCNVFKNNI